MATSNLIAQTIINRTEGQLTDTILHEAKRTLLNALGVAVYGFKSPGVSAYLGAFSEAEQSNTLNVVLDASAPLSRDVVATAVALATHMDDFDDTHEQSSLHASASVLGAVLSDTSQRGASGKRLLNAIISGCEVAFWVATPLQPEHAQIGWHTTGTCGGIAAAVAASRLRGADAETLARAIRLAAAGASGIRESFGTMCKPLNAGKAASNGLRSALLAEAGQDVADPFDLGDSFFRVSGEMLGQSLANGHLRDWELLRNTYKAYPCGLVSHCVIDAARQIHGEMDGRTGIFDSVVIEAHPTVPELMGIRHPETELEARFSAIHCCAQALLNGTLAMDQLREPQLTDPTVAGVREVSELVGTPTVPRRTAIVTANLADGRSFTATTAAHRGSSDNPLSDEELEEKFRNLTSDRTRDYADRVIDLVWNLEDRSVTIEDFVSTLIGDE